MSRSRLVGALLRGVPDSVRMRSQGMGEAPVKVHRWRLHQTTQAGECPLCGAERLEDGAPAPRARYALVQYQLLTLSGCGCLVRSVCFASATFTYGSHLGNNERTILCATNKSDFSRLQR